MRVTKRLIGVFLALATVFTYLPATLIGTAADGAGELAYEYRCFDETTGNFSVGICETYETVTGSTTDVTWNSGWYVQSKYIDPLDINGSVTVNGDVHLILTNRSLLRVAKGIHVLEGNSLTVYAVSDEIGTMGELITSGDENCAGIGGMENKKNGTVTIHGGRITATGGELAAGIGGGNNGSGGTVKIYGGYVQATGDRLAAGIGGGRNCGMTEISVYGGTVIATGGADAAGIGGGSRSGEAVGKINVYGGDVTATGNGKGAGIGGGNFGDGGTVSIYAGIVTAKANGTGCGIGVGVEGDENDITVNGGSVAASSVGSSAFSGNPDVVGGIIFKDNTTGNVITKADDEEWSDVLVNRSKVTVEAPTISYLVYKGENERFPGSTLKPSVMEATYLGYGMITPDMEDLRTGWYAVDGALSLENQLRIHGDARLILKNGCAADLTAGLVIEDGACLTVYSQSEDETVMGQLQARGEAEGIKGTLVLHTGKVSAHGGDAHSAFAGNATIYGGILQVHGYETGAGFEGRLTVLGGTFDAEGGLSSTAFNLGSTVFEVKCEIDLISEWGLPILRSNLEEWLDVFNGQYVYFSTAPSPVSFVSRDETAVSSKTYEYTVIDKTTTSLTSGYYIIDGVGTLSRTLNVSGDVHLILKNNAKLTTSGFILGTNSSLNIYAQPEKDGEAEGKLIADASVWNTAGIDCSGNTRSDGSVVIHGGNIVAKGGTDAAGIGGRRVSGNGTIIIYGGKIEVYGGDSGAGIGGGNRAGTRERVGCGANLFIYGGDIYAEGGKDGAGIGGGCRGSAGYTTIAGGNVTAIGGSSESSSSGGAGIGGGSIAGSNFTDEDDVVITGGTVKAIGGIRAAGIGGGTMGIACFVNISGGDVYAEGGEGAPGFGAGEDCQEYMNYDGLNYGGALEISGGSVTAKAGPSCSRAFDIDPDGECKDLNLVIDDAKWVIDKTTEQRVTRGSSREWIDVFNGNEYSIAVIDAPMNESWNPEKSAYLVTVPTVQSAGAYNKKMYYLDADGNQAVAFGRLFDTDQTVTFENWFLRTMVQYKKGENRAADVRLISMLDDHLTDYKEAGFILTVAGEEIDPISTTVANKSFLAAGNTVSIGQYSREQDHFFMQKISFARGSITTSDIISATPYVKLLDGTTVTGAAVQFTLSQIMPAN